MLGNVVEQIMAHLRYDFPKSGSMHFFVSGEKVHQVEMEPLPGDVLLERLSVLCAVFGAVLVVSATRCGDLVVIDLDSEKNHWTCSAPVETGRLGDYSKPVCVNGISKQIFRKDVQYHVVRPAELFGEDYETELTRRQKAGEDPREVLYQLADTHAAIADVPAEVAEQMVETVIADILHRPTRQLH